jgi:hypothetical protein
MDKPIERWRELCELAKKEQNPEKLLALVNEINRLLEEEEARLHPKRESHEAAGEHLPLGAHLSAGGANQASVKVL